MFNGLGNIAYAPDVVLAMPHEKELHVAQLNHVITSVIDFASRPAICDYVDDYRKFIVMMCNHCVNKGLKPIIVAFCEFEGDNNAAKEIFEMLDEKSREYVLVEVYNDLEQMVELFQTAKYVIATRFHAMILALKFGVPFFAIAYNDKISNVLEDIGSDQFCLPDCLDKICASDVLEHLENMSPPSYDEYMINSEKQFEQLERFLKAIK